MRFTTTRAVSGFRRSIIHCAVRDGHARWL
jgi:hypothetical protein